MALHRTLGQIAYEAFAAYRVNDDDNRPYPSWSEMNSDHQHGWEVAAQAACNAKASGTTTV